MLNIHNKAVKMKIPRLDLNEKKWKLSEMYEKKGKKIEHWTLLFDTKIQKTEKTNRKS